MGMGVARGLGHQCHTWRTWLGFNALSHQRLCAHCLEDCIVRRAAAASVDLGLERRVLRLGAALRAGTPADGELCHESARLKLRVLAPI